MKTAIYIEDGVVQLVLTPENNFEKNALISFEDKPHESHIYIGSFYECRGGWTRHSEFCRPFPDSAEERSLILRMESVDSGGGEVA